MIGFKKKDDLPEDFQKKKKAKNPKRRKRIKQGIALIVVFAAAGGFYVRSSQDKNTEIGRAHV